MPWGLGRAYGDGIWAFLSENDGWNSDGSMGGREFNRVPFSGDFGMTDSEGNSWTPYEPWNSPYEVSKALELGAEQSVLRATAVVDCAYPRPFWQAKLNIVFRVRAVPLLGEGRHCTCPPS